MGIERLKGLTLTEINGAQVGSEQITFTVEGGKSFWMYHSQDCCESVNVEDIAGDIADLIGSPILEAEEVTNSDEPEGGWDAHGGYRPESFTWTFYKLGTIKGHVTLRWLGSSNGYYSESVYFCETGKSPWDADQS
jgi:hypothetical protein